MMMDLTQFNNINDRISKIADNQIKMDSALERVAELQRIKNDNEEKLLNLLTQDIKKLNEIIIGNDRPGLGEQIRKNTERIDKLESKERESGQHIRAIWVGVLVALIAAVAEFVLPHIFK